MGTDSNRLIGPEISSDAKDAYLTLGKCHYEVVCSLEYTAKALYDIHTENPFVSGKAIKDFYFHSGALLDILSRIIFVINVPNCHSDKDKKGQYRRNLMDRGKLLQDYETYVSDYLPFLASSVIQELVSIRNLNGSLLEDSCQGQHVASWRP